MKGELKELLFAQLQALSRAYQSAVSIMSAYEREFERLEKEINEERSEREKERSEREKERAENEALKLEVDRLVKSNDELRGELRSLATRNEEEDDPLSVV